MKRRQWMTTGVAMAAAAAGAGVAWWRLAPREADAPAVAAFWASQFQRPDGQVLAMAGLRGRPLLVNFWATWCPPCVEELPLLNAFQTEQAPRGWQVVGLAVDQQAPVQRFLQKLPLNFPVGLAGFAGTDLSRSLGNLGGGLPFSVVFGADGAVRHQKVGKLSAEDLAQWAQLA